jgi:Flp pilus assembly protein TadD
MNPRSTRTTNARLVLGVGLAIGLAAAGCSTQGSYTREASNLAAQRMGVIKAGTEWQMAHQAFLAGDLEKALRKVDASLAINDTVTKSHVLRGRVKLEMGDLSEALQSLLTASTIDPQHAEARYYLGIVHERLNEKDKAVEHYRAACELDGYNASFAVAAAEMMIDLGQLDQAQAFLTSGPMFDHNPGVRQALGHIAMIQGDTAKAAELFSQASLLSPEDPAILEDLIRAQMASADFNDAEHNIRRLMEIDEAANRRDLEHLRAQCLLELDRPVEAREIYTALTKGDAGASDVEAWIGIGDAAYVLGDDKSLRRAASRVVAMAPERADGYSLWALLHRKEGNLDRALSSLDHASELAPEDASVHAFRGLVLTDLGRAKEAALAFVDAATLDPTNAEYQRMLEWAEYAAASAPVTTE